MIDQAIRRLDYLCESIPLLLSAIDEASFSEKPVAGKWSKKEILGHLIDSAANNHHRLIRTQFEHVPLITYDQDSWNRYGHYQQMNSRHLIAFWTIYNKHLSLLIKQIPAEQLDRKTLSGIGNAVNLYVLIPDYVAHLEHHLGQILPGYNG